MGGQGEEALASAPVPSGYRCAECRKRPPPYDRLISTWSYAPPLDLVVTGLKFRRLDYLGIQLGRLMAEIHREDLCDCELVVPVPLYWTRRLRRGFNQAAVIARPLARALDLPLDEPIKRHRSTSHQSRLGRGARHRNLDHAFALRRPRPWKVPAVPGRHVLLVDDVTTTGATLAAAATCLKKAGARAVTAITAARTPLKHERA